MVHPPLTSWWGMFMVLGAGPVSVPHQNRAHCIAQAEGNVKGTDRYYWDAGEGCGQAVRQVWGVWR